MDLTKAVINTIKVDNQGYAQLNPVDSNKLDQILSELREVKDRLNSIEAIRFAPPKW